MITDKRNRMGYCHGIRSYVSKVAVISAGLLYNSCTSDSALFQRASTSSDSDDSPRMSMNPLRLSEEPSREPSPSTSESSSTRRANSPRILIRIGHRTRSATSLPGTSSRSRRPSENASAIVKAMRVAVDTKDTSKLKGIILNGYYIDVLPGVLKVVSGNLSPASMKYLIEELNASKQCLLLAIHKEEKKSQSLPSSLHQRKGSAGAKLSYVPSGGTLLLGSSHTDDVKLSRESRRTRVRTRSCTSLYTPESTSTLLQFFTQVCLVASVPDKEVREAFVKDYGLKEKMALEGISNVLPEEVRGAFTKAASKLQEHINTTSCIRTAIDEKLDGKRKDAILEARLALRLDGNAADNIDEKLLNEWVGSLLCILKNSKKKAMRQEAAKAIQAIVENEELLGVDKTMRLYQKLLKYSSEMPEQQQTLLETMTTILKKAPQEVDISQYKLPSLYSTLSRVASNPKRKPDLTVVYRAYAAAATLAFDKRGPKPKKADRNILLKHAKEGAGKHAPQLSVAIGALARLCPTELCDQLPSLIEEYKRAKSVDKRLQHMGAIVAIANRAEKIRGSKIKCLINFFGEVLNAETEQVQNSLTDPSLKKKELYAMAKRGMISLLRAIKHYKLRHKVDKHKAANPAKYLDNIVKQMQAVLQNRSWYLGNMALGVLSEIPKHFPIYAQSRVIPMLQKHFQDGKQRIPESVKVALTKALPMMSAKAPVTIPGALEILVHLVGDLEQAPPVLANALEAIKNILDCKAVSGHELAALQDLSRCIISCQYSGDAEVREQAVGAARALLNWMNKRQGTEGTYQLTRKQLKATFPSIANERDFEAIPVVEARVGA